MHAYCFWKPHFSGKHLKIMNLGNGQDTTGGVTDVLRDTDDDAVDPHLERIKNQAGDDESDEEVWCPVVGMLFVAVFFSFVTEPPSHVSLLFYPHFRMKILLLIRMTVDLLRMTLVRNQMLVTVVERRR
jgi:hypothetical protein